MQTRINPKPATEWGISRELPGLRMAIIIMRPEFNTSYNIRR
jgi:hypothetical protein